VDFPPVQKFELAHGVEPVDDVVVAAAGRAVYSEEGAAEPEAEKEGQ